MWKAKPFKVLTGEIAKRVRPAEKSFLCFVMYCWWLYEAAKMLFAQPTDSISNSEEMILLGVWYIGFQYIYIIYSAVLVVEMQYLNFKKKMNSA